MTYKDILDTDPNAKLNKFHVLAKFDLLRTNAKNYADTLAETRGDTDNDTYDMMIRWFRELQQQAERYIEEFNNG